MLRDRLVQPDADPQICRQWIRTYSAAKFWSRAARDVEALDCDEAIWLRAAGRLLEALAESKPAEKTLVRGFVRRRRGRLESDLSAWGTAGYAMSAVGLHRQAVKWLGAWRSRPGVRPWILSNVSASLYCLYRDTEAAEVHRFALGLEPDHATPIHQVYLAVHEFAAGNFAVVEQLLAAVANKPLKEFNGAVRGLMVEAIKLRGDESLRGWNASSKALRRLRQSSEAYRKQRPTSLALQRFECKLMQRLARERGWRLTGAALHLAGAALAVKSFARRFKS